MAEGEIGHMQDVSHVSNSGLDTLKCRSPHQSVPARLLHELSFCNIVVSEVLHMAPAVRPSE